MLASFRCTELLELAYSHFASEAAVGPSERHGDCPPLPLFPFSFPPAPLLPSARILAALVTFPHFGCVPLMIPTCPLICVLARGCWASTNNSNVRLLALPGLYSPLPSLPPSPSFLNSQLLQREIERGAYVPDVGQRFVRLEAATLGPPSL